MLRTRSARWLLLAALAVSLLMGAGLVGLHRVTDARREAAAPSARPLTDSQTSEQVLASARDFVRVGRFGNPAASYTLMPCWGEDGPPYQGSAYINFDVPTITETPAFFDSILAGMAAGGWTEGVRPNTHPGGRTLGRAGVSALLYRNPDRAGRGVLQIYGECRNVSDHGPDAGQFVDITAKLRN